MRNLFVLILLGWASVASGQALNELKLVGKATLLPTEFVASSRVDANGEICAAILIESDLNGFTYDANNGVVGVERKPGQDVVYLSPGERVLTVLKSGFAPRKLILAELGIRLESKRIWKIRLTGTKQGGDIPVNFRIQPAPDEVRIDGRVVDAQKPVLLSAGAHQLVIRKSGYREISERITVSLSQNLFERKLTEIDPLTVSIESQPPGATVYIQGIEKGKTPLQFFQFPGTYTIELIQSGYDKVQSQITVSETGSNRFPYSLTKSAGTLVVNRSPADAQWQINGQVQRSDRVELAPGLYKIEASASGFRPYSQTIQIDKGKEQQLAIRLVEITGKLQFSIQPSTASVELLRNNTLVKRWTGLTILSDIRIGEYQIRAQQTGYQSKTETITLKEGRNVVNLTLTKANTEQTTASITYKSVRIGTQVWMTRNLDVSSFRNGDPIPEAKSKAEWEQASDSGQPAWCYYDNDPANGKKYGKLYNWYAVNDPRGLAPAGWHVPSDAEWSTLEKNLGRYPGTQLKSRSGWKGNGNGTNQSGFSGLPGGYRFITGNFSGLGKFGYWWSSSEESSTSAWGRFLDAYYGDLTRYYGDNEGDGMSVRCVRD